jgi:transcriptional regulator with XRE-family HTH domain
MSSDRSHMWAEATPITSAQALGWVIGRRRRSLGLSQRKLGAQAVVAPAVISRLELTGDESTPLGVVLRLVDALELDPQLRPRGSPFTPTPPTKLTELGLSPLTMMAVTKEKLESIEQLDPASLMLARPEFRSGSELYEIICALTRHGLTPPGGRGVPSRRDHEVLRRRIIDGLTLEELAREHDLHTERIRQLLGLFGVSGIPPAASLRRMRKKGRTSSSQAEDGVTT